jgi:hypothetical protein
VAGRVAPLPAGRTDGYNGIRRRKPETYPHNVSLPVGRVKRALRVEFRTAPAGVRIELLAERSTITPSNSTRPSTSGTASG